MNPPAWVEAKVLQILPIAKARRRILRQSARHCASEPSTVSRPRILAIDLSIISVRDAGTGVQRVAREITHQALLTPPAHHLVITLRADKTREFCVLDLVENRGKKALCTTSSANLRNGDTFLALDFSPRLLPKMTAQLVCWKREGASIQTVLYDMLPRSHPEWFTQSSSRNYKHWIRTITTFSDKVHCISNTVRLEFLNWMHASSITPNEAPTVSVFPLGGNFTSFEDGCDEAVESRALDRLLDWSNFVLVVGTIEPRKGHAEILAAFDALWAEKHASHLVFAGAAGWNTNSLQARIRSHREYGNRLIWIDDANDTTLRVLYQHCKGVIVASHAEGLGLPLLEAAHYGKPVLARDIPVFREFALATTTFFPEANDTLTSDAVASWISSMEVAHEPPQAPTWRESCSALLCNMGLAA